MVPVSFSWGSTPSRVRGAAKRGPLQRPAIRYSRHDYHMVSPPVKKTTVPRQSTGFPALTSEQNGLPACPLRSPVRSPTLPARHKCAEAHVGLPAQYNSHSTGRGVAPRGPANRRDIHVLPCACDNGPAPRVEPGVSFTSLTSLHGPTRGKVVPTRMIHYTCQLAVLLRGLRTEPGPVRYQTNGYRDRAGRRRLTCPRISPIRADTCWRTPWRVRTR